MGYPHVARRFSASKTKVMAISQITAGQKVVLRPSRAIELCFLDHIHKVAGKASKQGANSRLCTSQ